MANKTVYPYGTDGTLPSSIGIINDLTTGGADKALSAEMGVEIADEFKNVNAFIGDGEQVSDPISLSWVQGSINTATGANISNTISLRCGFIQGIGKNHVIRFECGTGYFIKAVVAYNSALLSDYAKAIYIGNESGSFDKTKTTYELYPGEYVLRVVVGRTDDGTISVSEGNNISATDNYTALNGKSIVENIEELASPLPVDGKTINADVYGKTITTTGATGSNSLYVSTQDIDVSEGDSFTYYGYVGPGAIACGGYNSDGTFVSALIGNDHDYTKGGVSFIVPSGVAKIRFCGRIDHYYLFIRKNVSADVPVSDLLTPIANKKENGPFSGRRVSIIGSSISTAESANAVEFVVLPSDITAGRTLQGYPTYYDIGTTIGGVTIDSSMVGVLTSFTPVSGDEGKVVGKALNYNTIAANKIWWYIALQELGAVLLQNVSWSGGSISSHEGNTNTLKTSYAWHPAQIRKLAARDDDGNTIAPDIVIIYRGTNDLSHTPYAAITDFGDSAMEIPDDDYINGVYDFKVAYCKTIQAIRNAYQEARVYCCTLNVFKRVNYSQFPTNNGTDTLPQFNNAIREVADMMGCGLIELDKDGITFENCYPTYISDSATIPTHPNARGHAVIARKVVADMLNQPPAWE